MHRVMKKENSVDILKDIVKKSAANLALRRCWVFQQDNGPKHTSKLVENFLKFKSPDLSTYENLLQELNVKVHAQKEEMG